MEQVRLKYELDAGVRDLDKPVMVRPANPGTVNTPRLLFDPRRHFDIAGLANPIELLADPYGVPYVFESVGADDEIELVVFKRPGLLGTNVSDHPRLPSEALRLRIRLSIQPPRLVRHEVKHPIRASKRVRPATNIEDEIIPSQATEDPGTVSGEHSTAEVEASD